MSEVQVRPFRRPDREQLTALVNAHIQAVVPGVSVSVNTVMSQLERDPGEFIVDPWVAERTTLVAEQRGRVVAAAHLLRFGTGEEVGEDMRGAGEVNWLLYWPEASYWPDSGAAAEALMTACLAQLRSLAGDALVRRRRPARPRRVRRSPSSGRTSARCTSGRVRPRRPHRDRAASPGSTSCRGRRSRPSPACGWVVPSASTARGSTGRSATSWSATSRSRPTWPRAGASPTSAAGPTSATSTSTRPTAAAASPPGWSGTRRTGCAWPGWSGCWSMPGPKRKPCGPCWPASASASSLAPPAAGTIEFAHEGSGPHPVRPAGGGPDRRGGQAGGQGPRGARQGPRDHREPDRLRPAGGQAVDLPALRRADPAAADGPRERVRRGGRGGGRRGHVLRGRRPGVRLEP